MRGIGAVLISSVFLFQCARGGDTGSQLPEPQAGEYENQFLPQDFSLQMPKSIFSSSEGVMKSQSSSKSDYSSPKTVNLNKCYIDEAASSGEPTFHASRLCGVQFNQVKLEVEALFLDLALPHIRALCKNKLPSCGLSGQSVQVTVSEPVMRRLERLYWFYDYVGLNDYYSYNGITVHNGAKIDYTIEDYREYPGGLYDYSAVLKRTVIITQGSAVETRPKAAEIRIFWNRSRSNILLDFKTLVDAFGYVINARRVYDYQIGEKLLNYSSQVNYWSDGSSLKVNHGISIAQCRKEGNPEAAALGTEYVQDCVNFKSIGADSTALDFNRNDFTADEMIYMGARTSEGRLGGDGGVVENNDASGRRRYFSDGDGIIRSRWIYDGSGNAVFEAGSLIQNFPELKTFSGYYASVNAADAMTSGIAAVVSVIPLAAEAYRTLYRSSTDPDSPESLLGMGFSNAESTWSLVWNSASAGWFGSAFTGSGQQTYAASP